MSTKEESEPMDVVEEEQEGFEMRIETPHTSYSLISTVRSDKSQRITSGPLGDWQSGLSENERTSLRRQQKKQRETVLNGREAMRNKLNSLKAQASRANLDDKGRLQYLMEKADIFVSQDATKKNKGRPRTKSADLAGRRGKNRMTEEEEDKKMLDQKPSTAIRVSRQPRSISTKTGTMRDYQIEGLNWMIDCFTRGINGILADEMGLGKTLQSISVLAFLRDAFGIENHHLVVVPKSTLGNWVREFNRWAPHFRVFRFHGPKSERPELKDTLLNKRDKYDVVVTSYEMLKIERTSFMKIPFQFLVLDEAHAIKNENSRLSIVVREMNVQSRLLLTGTPLQNNMRELWALLNFLLPQVFDSAENFEAWFDVEDTELEKNALKRLHAILRPFLLRRLKNDVEKSLLPKIETKLYIGMSEMQKWWYKNVIMKDATTLNQLGGTGRVKLLNILMQLRKTCNHPYLFNGAEPGPPYDNGPHLWENCGKMVLLHKLLIRLKKQGSRVLIFSQMTRMLDILEDYMMVHGYKYCRIDGGTSGELRDSQMDDFNAPGSEKFVFMLSTRAGGLGINLATADIVILYDSDWNPQVDLQAMDRAHRIGQKKQVRVFRFVTEKSVEEKIVERAERKLYLDAVVIQQGRLMQQNKKLSKEEVNSMIRFGADEIFKADDVSSITDADIDAILAIGEKRTKEFSDKIKSDMAHTLSSFKLETLPNEEKSIYDYDEERFVNETSGGETSTMIALPQRDRKRNYNVNDYFQNALSENKSGENTRQRKPKSIQMFDYQFFDQTRIRELFQIEFEYSEAKRAQVSKIKELRTNAVRMRRRASRGDVEAAEKVEELDAEADALETTLSKHEFPSKLRKEREDLIAEAFAGWNKNMFRKVISACEMYGRDKKDDIVRHVSAQLKMTQKEVSRYLNTLLTRGPKELSDWSRIEDKIVKGEEKIARVSEIERLIKEKVKSYKNPWYTLSLDYSNARSKSYTEEEDRWLICTVNEIGYGKWAEMRLRIRVAWQFRFDWWIKSRSSTEIQRRVDSLVRIIERENVDRENGNAGGRRKRKR